MSRFAIRSSLKAAALKFAQSIITAFETGEDVAVDGEVLLNEAESGALEYTMFGRWVDGTTLRDMMAGAAARSAIWCATDDECKPLDGAVLVRGPYMVHVKVEVEFEPLPPDADLDDEVFNASAMVHRLQSESGVDIVVN